MYPGVFQGIGHTHRSTVAYAPDTCLQLCKVLRPLLISKSTTVKLVVYVVWVSTKVLNVGTQFWTVCTVVVRVLPGQFWNLAIRQQVQAVVGILPQAIMTMVESGVIGVHDILSTLVV